MEPSGVLTKLIRVYYIHCFNYLHPHHQKVLSAHTDPGYPTESSKTSIQMWCLWNGGAKEDFPPTQCKYATIWTVVSITFSRPPKSWVLRSVLLGGSNTLCTRTKSHLHPCNAESCLAQPEGNWKLFGTSSVTHCWKQIWSSSVAIHFQILNWTCKNLSHLPLSLDHSPPFHFTHCNKHMNCITTQIRGWLRSFCILLCTDKQVFFTKSAKVKYKWTWRAGDQQTNLTNVRALALQVRSKLYRKFFPSER